MKYSTKQMGIKRIGQMIHLDYDKLLTLKRHKSLDLLTGHAIILFRQVTSYRPTSVLIINKMCDG